MILVVKRVKIPITPRLSRGYETPASASETAFTDKQSSINFKRDCELDDCSSSVRCTIGGRSLVDSQHIELERRVVLPLQDFRRLIASQPTRICRCMSIHLGFSLPHVSNPGNGLLDFAAGYPLVGFIIQRLHFARGTTTRAVSMK